MADDYGPGDHVMVTVDPARNYGSASLSRRMVPLVAPVGMLLAGEDPDTVRDEYDLTEAEGRVVEALAGVVRATSSPEADPIEPTPEKVATALEAMAAWGRQCAAEHSLGPEEFAGQDGVRTEQAEWVLAFTAAASLVRGLDPAALLHEWKCPACGATTRARMADYPGGGR